MTGNAQLSYEDQYRHAVGIVFRRLRADLGLSLRDFAERVGTSHTNLYAAEKGETTPGIDVIGGVATACGLNLTEILYEIVDQLADDPGSVSGMISDLNKMTARDRREARQFIDFLKYRESKSLNPG